MADPAYQKALRLLARRGYFRRELVERLKVKGFEADDAERAVERCVALGLVDDLALAQRFVELRALDRGWGTRRLRVEMERRGASPEVAEEATRLGPETKRAALERALELVERRQPDGWWRVGARRARVLSSLIGRGFDADDADRAVRELRAQRENDHDGTDDQSADPIDLP